jgi:hypothetical protein
MGAAHLLPSRGTAALLALGLLAVSCKREEEGGPTRAVAPYLEWCEAQGAARNSCLVSAARVSGDAAACAKLKGGGPERTACLVAAAKTSGRSDVCRPLADRDLVLCALGVTSETGRASACDVLESVHWQGGGARAVCAAIARGEPSACSPLPGGELGELCLRFLAVRRRDAGLCTPLGKETAAFQRCAVAVALARGAPEACATAFSVAADIPEQRKCEQDAAVAKGTLSPCFSEPLLCERSLWVARPCEGATGTWADDCHIHEAVFGTGPFGCGAVRDGTRRALCARLRDAQEGYTRARGVDAGTVLVPP